MSKTFVGKIERTF